MILKLSIYVDVEFKDDPALLPLLRSFLEEHLIEAFDERIKDWGECPTEQLFDEVPKDFINTSWTVKTLTPTQVRYKQIQLLRETQSNLNKKKQRVSPIKTPPSKKKTTKSNSK